MKKSNRLRDRKTQSSRQKRRGIVAVLVLLALVFAQFSSTGLTASVQAADEEEAAEAAVQTKDDTLDVELDDETIAAQSETEEESSEIAEDEKGEKSEAETEDETSDEEEEEDEDDEEAATFKETKGGVTVTVEAPAGALPEDAKLQVKRYDEDSSEYKEAAKAIDFDENENGMAALDISFTVDGEEVEPEEAVKVSIDASNILPEDADASTLEVQHLKEGRAGQVKAEVVANDSSSTEGTINESKKTAEFEVDSFSVFTVEWNDGTTDTIEVHVYNVNGTSIDEELNESSTEIANNGTIEISELVAHLESHSTLATEYTYQYATVIYETNLGGPGYSSDTLGSSDDSIASITKNGTTYTVTYENGGTDSTSDPADIVIHLYYSTPTISLVADDPYADTVSFTVESEYFQHEDEGEVSYAWALSNDSAGTLTHDTVGEATFVWAEDASAGDQVTVTVTKTVTYGDGQTEVASDTYTLTYGEDPVTFTVTLNGTPQANAHVAIVDENGNTISTGITDENGQVTLYTIDGGTYTVGVTYCVADTSGMGGGSTTRYSAEGTVTLSDEGEVTSGDTTLALGGAVVSGPNGDTNGMSGGGESPYYYEHIDVKIAAASTQETQATFSDLDAVYVYDKYGNLIYVSEDLERNPETGDYNCLFDINGDEDQHSIVVSSEDTIVIVYEVQNEDGSFSTYTATYQSGGTYPSGEYYSYDFVNAYQLYNYKYGTSLTEDQFLEQAEAGTLQDYNENGIDIGGMGYTEVADCLCDTRTTSGQSGLDFVIDVAEIDSIFGQYDFRVAKSLVDVPTTLSPSDFETFTFDLQELSSGAISDGDTYTEQIWSTAGAEGPTTGSTSEDSWTLGRAGNWNGIVDFGDALTYEAEDGTYFYYYILSEEDPTTATAEQQYYGLKVTVTYSSSTGVATIVVSYCPLTKVDNTTYNRAGQWEDLSANTATDEVTGEDYTYYAVPFINTYSTTGFELEKVDDSGNKLAGSVFTMSTSDGTELYFTSGTDDEDNTVYTLSAEGEEGASTEIAVTDGGPVSIQGIAAGTYTLSETTAPNGYIAVDDFTVTIADDGTVTVNGTNVSVADDSDVVTVTDLEATSITVTKTWVDNNNVYETRPESITVTITGSDGNTYTLTLNDDNEWKATQDNLPKTDSDGDEITYEVTEETVDGYTGTVVNHQDGTYTITNTLTGTTEITVSKTWVDSNNGYNTRPESVSVTITGSDENTYSLTLNEGNSWRATQSELPLYDSTGTEITYTVTEESVNGYTGTVVKNDDGTYTITNTLETVDVEGSKTWTGDSDYAESYRPTSITIHLLADGTEVDSATVTSSDDWKWSFTDLPKYRSDGTTEIEYTITEDAVPGYTTEVSGYDVTNTLITTEVSGEKTWVDEDNANNTRPDSITIYLYADGVQTGDTAVVTSSENWAWSFTDLPMYNSEGKEIVYTIMEGETEEGHLGEYIPSYSDDGLSVTNSVPVVSKYVSDPAYDESVEEELGEDEADNNDTLEYEIKAEHVGNAHELVFHDLLDNHLDIDTLEIESVTLYKDADDSGTEITDYTYTTDTCGGTDCNMDGCSFEISIPDEDLTSYGSDAYIVIIFDITLKENVDDFDDNYVEETDNWANISFFSYYATPVEVETYSYGFDLYKYDEDTNDPLEGAEFVMSNSDGKYAQFEETDGTYLLTGWTDSKGDATAIVSGSDGNAVIEGLHDGTFNIEETKTPEGYQQVKGTFTVTITVDEDDPKNPTITATNASVSGEEVQIANTQGSEDTVSIIGAKTWDDGNDADGVRPDSITIRLYADGTEVDSKKVTADDGWAWRFSNLDKYQSDGTTEINYTITEDAVADYDTTYYDENYNVTNTHTPENVTGPGPAQPNPGNGGNGGNGGPGTVKTSDTNNIGLWLFLLIAAAAVIAGSVFVRMRRYRY